jgi:two-component system, NtrC family, sensor kinase
MFNSSVVNWLSGLRVGQKIGLGYAIALGIAVSGTMVGFGLGNRYQQQANQQEELIRGEVELLHRLQTEILQCRTHQQQLIPLTRNLEEFEQEYAHILEHEQQVETSWAELKAFIDRQAAGDNFHRQNISKFLQTYDGVPKAYAQELNRQIQSLRLSKLDASIEITQAQTSLLAFTNSDLALQFDAISDDLVGLLDQAYRQADDAEEQQHRAGDIARVIVLISIGLSITISILLSIITSRAIAQPIQTLTYVARRSTEESNFDLKATVNSRDEIGTLADSFNQLTDSMQKLLTQQKAAHEQLASYNQTLEQKVEERTQELSDKNQQLQELLNKLHQTQMQMVHNEKMLSLGQLVAGVAHEINNPVNFISGNLTYVQGYAQDLLHFIELYQKHYPDPIAEIKIAAETIELKFVQDDLPKLLSSMQIGTNRLCQIVLSLRNFSRIDESEFKAVNIHEGIDSTLLILQHRLKARPECPEIKVIRDYGDLPLIECYAGQLNQAFMNILSNAIDALEEINAKRTYREIESDPNCLTIRTSMPDPEWVKISIADNGPGIPEKIQQKIFEPFFTTKPVGKGTGMGMSISHQIIVEKHGGKCDCVSVPGKGTEFIIQIPVKQQAPHT